MAMDPQNMKKYLTFKNVWVDQEWPSLVSRYKKGGYGAPSRLIAIDAATPNQNQYLVDFESFEVLHSSVYIKRDEDGLNISSPYEDIRKRDGCDANVAYELPTEDWFG